MADRFNRIDNTAPIVDVAENTTPTASKSNFDENRKIITQAVPYAIIPIDTIFCLPNTEVYLNYDVQVTFRNPAVRKMLNGWRVYLHAYYNRCQDLWEGWNNFITKGRSGNISLKIPHIKTRINGQTPFTPMSLYNYLGYPSEAIPVKNTNGTPIPILDKTTGVKVADVTGNNVKKTGLADYTNEEINALKAVMYQKLWRDKYSPKNLLQDNKHLFPDNDDHFILSYNADEVAVINYEAEKESPGGDLNDKTYYTMDDPNKHVRIDCLRFRQFQGDRFTTASPFPEMTRGDIPNMDIELNIGDISKNLKIDTLVTTGKLALASGTKTYRTNLKEAANAEHKTDEVPFNRTVYTQEEGKYIILKRQPDNSLNPENVIGETVETYLTGTGNEQNATIKSSITLSKLRSLEVMSIFAERMARTNGDYNEMIKAQFGYNPKSNNREAIYIGGSFQDIVLNSIYQTSESTDKSALGQQVAQGISASYNKLGNFHANDYGFIMVVMSIVPDTIYTTGLSKLDTALTFEDQYFPIMNNLNAEPILNKELFVSGNKEKDNDLWGYAERFSEYKSRRNHVSGFSELPNTIDEYDSALVMARRFNKTPEYNADFVTGYPDNYSLDGFTSKDEPPFDVAIRQDVNVMYPMPYVTIPQGLGTRA